MEYTRIYKNIQQTTAKMKWKVNVLILKTKVLKND